MFEFFYLLFISYFTLSFENSTGKQITLISSDEEFETSNMFLYKSKVISISNYTKNDFLEMQKILERKDLDKMSCDQIIRGISLFNTLLYKDQYKYFFIESILEILICKFEEYKSIIEKLTKEMIFYLLNSMLHNVGCSIKVRSVTFELSTFSFVKNKSNVKKFSEISGFLQEIRTFLFVPKNWAEVSNALSAKKHYKELFMYIINNFEIIKHIRIDSLLEEIISHDCNINDFLEIKNLEYVQFGIFSDILKNINLYKEHEFFSKIKGIYVHKLNYVDPKNVNEFVKCDFRTVIIGNYVPNQVANSPAECISENIEELYLCRNGLKIFDSRALSESKVIRFSIVFDSADVSRYEQIFTSAFKNKLEHLTIMFPTEPNKNLETIFNLVGDINCLVSLIFQSELIIDENFYDTLLKFKKILHLKMICKTINGKFVEFLEKIDAHKLSINFLSDYKFNNSQNIFKNIRSLVLKLNILSGNLLEALKNGKFSNLEIYNNGAINDSLKKLFDSESLKNSLKFLRLTKFMISHNEIAFLLKYTKLQRIIFENCEFKIKSLDYLNCDDRNLIKVFIIDCENAKNLTENLKNMPVKITKINLKKKSNLSLLSLTKNRLLNK